MRKVIRNLFRQIDYENVIEAENEEEAFALLKSQKMAPWESRRKGIPRNYFR